MKLIAPCLALATIVSALSEGQRLSFHALDDTPALFRRVTTTCKPVKGPLTCEKSCGAGQITCVSLPSCYNPAWGESCCKDGTYCRSGYYCTDKGCCPVGKTLEQCGAVENTKLDDPKPDSSSSASSGPSSQSMVEGSASDSTIRMTKTATATATVSSTSGTATTKTAEETDEPSETSSSNSTASDIATDGPATTASNSTANPIGSTGATTSRTQPTNTSADDAPLEGGAVRITSFAAALVGVAAAAAAFA